MKKVIILVCFVGITCALSTIFLMNIRKPKEEKPKYEHIELIGTEDEYGDVNNQSYYTDTGGSYDKLELENTTNTVFVNNEYVLFENGMDDYGINSLDDYLLRYLNYYIGEDRYEATIQENSFVEDINYPSFEIAVTGTKEEKEYIIKCIYKTYLQRYSFSCEEIGTVQ